MQSDATSVAQYLAELPADRRAAIEAVRQTILANLPEGYEEAMNWGMIVYQVPLAASSRYLQRATAGVCGARLTEELHGGLSDRHLYGRRDPTGVSRRPIGPTGKRYDVGKSCVRFRKLDDLPLALIGESVALLGVDEFIAHIEQVHPVRKSKRA